MRSVGENLLKFVPNFTVIDLETTGRSNKFEDITELSAIKYRNYKQVDAFSTLVKPDNSILPFVVELTGITEEMVSDAPKIDQVIKQFVDFIGTDVILGHNVMFDYGLVYDAYLATVGLRMHNDYVDTLRVSRLLNKDSKNHKLETLCAYFDVERLVGHRGSEDCLQTAEVYIKMKDKYKRLRQIQKDKAPKVYPVEKRVE